MNNIITTVDNTILSSIKKIILLGYISPLKWPLDKLTKEISKNSDILIKAINDLPYYQDDLGLNIEGAIYPIYLLTFQDKKDVVILVDNEQKRSFVFNSKLHYTFCLRNKKIIYSSSKNHIIK